MQKLSANTTLNAVNSEEYKMPELIIEKKSLGEKAQPSSNKKYQTILQETPIKHSQLLFGDSTHQLDLTKGRVGQINNSSIFTPPK